MKSGDMLLMRLRAKVMLVDYMVIELKYWPIELLGFMTLYHQN